MSDTKELGAWPRDVAEAFSSIPRWTWWVLGILLVPPCLAAGWMMLQLPGRNPGFLAAGLPGVLTLAVSGEPGRRVVLSTLLTVWLMVGFSSIGWSRPLDVGIDLALAGLASVAVPVIVMVRRSRLRRAQAAQAAPPHDDSRSAPEDEAPLGGSAASRRERTTGDPST